jgi:LysR family transcriptional activator of nhaA
MIRKNGMNRLNYKHLRYFWAVAREGGVVRAGRALHVSPQTISGQLRQLEQTLGGALFARRGRRLELTDAGRVALGYADDIFALGRELTEVLQGGVARPAAELRVGVADAVPKAVAHRLIRPALELLPDLRLVCREQVLPALLGELAVHALDVVIADGPIPPGIDIRGFNLRLGDSAMEFFVAPALARRCRGRFPGCLDGAPMLLPSDESPLHGRALRWFGDAGVAPRVVGEFDDSALMKTFGAEGAGVFFAPAVIGAGIRRRYRVRSLGIADGLQIGFFAISVQRRITHPAVHAITASARSLLRGR